MHTIPISGLETCQVIMCPPLSRSLIAPYSAKGPHAPHAVVGVAAVADYHVANRRSHKLKKSNGGPPTIELAENPDILASVAALKDGPVLLQVPRGLQGSIDLFVLRYHTSLLFGRCGSLPHIHREQHHPRPGCRHQ